eukprot:gnl/Trimastix_PCT/3056.p1 GENE.gnl/Trimastix_PCT/3056~~gnl/Trimastix_PCT/3056.p1  ORF type:complete len:150 (+),score=3.26 gnl/Trimastix_PCT/3056:63-452(+)
MATERRHLYVGNLSEEVNRDVLAAAFMPFGELTEIVMPSDGTRAHRGFAFIQYETAEDASEAIFNMNDSELYGRVIKVNYAKPPTKYASDASRPAWDSDEFFKKTEEDKSAPGPSSEGPATLATTMATT